jgi:hypothetical protein
VVGISGGQLYLSANSTAGSVTNRTVHSVGTGLPTATPQTATPLPGLPNGTAPVSQPFAFVFLDRDENVPGDDTLYIADDGASGGVSKFVKDATGNWTSAKLKNPGPARGVATIVDGTTVHLAVVTNTNRLVTFVDDGTDTAAVTTVATPAANTAFRSVALAPIP